MAIIVWNGAGLASTDANWAGGVAPSTGDTATFDGTSVNNCTWDIVEVHGIDLEITYTGKLTLSINTLISDLDIVTNATQDFITDGFDLDIDGDYTLSGVGNGLTQVGGTLRFGADITMSGTQHSVFKGAGVLYGGSIDPLASVVHTVNMLNLFADPAGSLTVGENQSIVTTAGEDIDNFACGINSNVSSTAGFALLRIANITDPTNAKWGSDVIGGGGSTLILVFDGTIKQGADYADSEITIRTTSDIFGDFITTAIIRVTPPAGQNTFTLFGSLTGQDIEIGSTVANRGAILIQKAGSKVTTTRDLTVRSDDTFVETKWEREVGSLDTTIGRDFVVQADAALDFANDTSTLTVEGAINININAICNFGSTIIRHLGNIGNPAPANAFNDLVSITSGVPIQMTDTVTVDNGIWSLEGSGTFDFNGNTLSITGDGNQAFGAENVTFAGTGSLLLDFENVTAAGVMTLGAAAYPINLTMNRNAATEAQLVLTGDTEFDIVFASARVRTRLAGFTLTCPNRYENSGAAVPSVLDLESGILSCGNYDHTGAMASLEGTGSITASGQVRHTAGTMECSAVVVTSTGDHELSLGAVFDLGTGQFITRGKFVPLGDVDLGSGVYTLKGSSLDLTSVNLFTRDLGTFDFSGGVPQTITLAANALTNVICQKSLDTVSFVDALVCDLFMAAAVNGIQTIELKQTVAHTLTDVRCTGTAGNMTFLQSDTAGVQVIVNTAAVGIPAQFYVTPKDMNFADQCIIVDTLTGADGGNNVLC